MNIKGVDMDITIPKWIVEELRKDTERSLQYLIKLILKEYVEDEEWRNKIVEKERKREEDRKGGRSGIGRGIRNPNK